MPADRTAVPADRTAVPADHPAAVPAPADYLPWDHAWQEALYGPGGFYRRPEGPAGHFRTASHAAAPELAAALLRLAADTGCTAVLDLGAGRGEVLSAMSAMSAIPTTSTTSGVSPAPRPRLHGVDVVERPGGLPAGIGWSAGLHAVPDALWGHRLLLIAWELLDVVPCPVLEVDDGGVPRTVLVEPRTGREALGAPPDADQLAWCEQWWPPGDEPGHRVEVGRRRDALWSDVVHRVADGVLLAVDYAHTDRTRPPHGTLTGFRSGRAVPPRPDGSTDLTAHVAIDAVADAGRRAGASTTRLSTQREALAELGLAPRRRRGPGGLPLLDAPTVELLDPAALGGFSWLVQTRG